MGRWDSDADDWRGWKNGKYDNRYKGTYRIRKYRNPYKKKQAKKIGIAISLVVIIGIIGFLFSNGIFEINEENLNESIKNIPTSIPKEIQIPIQEKTDEIVTDINKQIEIVKKVPEIEKITSQIPKVEPPKQFSLEELKQISLDDINQYRTEQGLRTISLGSAKSPQLYSEELLLEGCIHHVSDNGEGPMLRYKNNNDQMYLIWENIGGGLGTNWETPDESIINSNYQMMFEDADSNWGHRDNILNPDHHSVSIGIAYDDQRLIMVQDFEQTLGAGYMYDPSSFQREPVDQRLCW
jgi:uncharacterized protein YkwD